MSSIWLHTRSLTERYAFSLKCTHRKYESGISSVWPHTQNVCERYVIRLPAITLYMRAVSHLFHCKHRLYTALCHLFNWRHRMNLTGMSSIWLYAQDAWEQYVICLTAHTECTRVICHLFDCRHRIHESVMSSIWLHTLNVWQRYVICLPAHTVRKEQYVVCLTARTECMRELCLLFDCTQSIY